MKKTASYSSCLGMIFFKGYTELPYIPFLCVSNELSFRSVSRQVLSPLQSLTSVFGMGTGGPSALESPTMVEELQAILPTSQSDVVHLQGFEPGTH